MSEHVMEMKHHGQHTSGEHSSKEVAKFVLVIASIVLASWYLTATYGPATFHGWSRWFMGTFFLVFAGFKFVGYKMFTEMFAMYDIVAKRSKAYAFAYPFIEACLAALYLGDLLPNARDLITLVVMGVGTIGVAGAIKARKGIHCACLGNLIKLPLSTVSLVEDAGMGLMALAMTVLVR